MLQKLRYILLFTFGFAAGLPAQTVWNGPAISFSKADYANPDLAENQDRITSTTWITRKNQAGIYNAFSETGYEANQSPANTEWATGTLEDYASLAFQPWEEWAQRNPPATIHVPAVLHLVDEDIYVGITFTAWTRGGAGGGFSYQRTTAGTPPLLTFYRDADQDGYGNPGDSTRAALQPAGYVRDKTDCNDSRAHVYPGAPELCDALDNDCNGRVDEGTSIAQFTLVNAGTGEDLGVLEEGRVIDLASLPGARLNIRARTRPAQAGRVVFALSGALVRTHTENLVPYALFGDDTRGNYYGAALPAGDYTLTATPYCTTQGTPLTIHFKIIYTAAVSGFTLVNADTDEEVKALKEGDVLDLSAFPGARLNIRAKVNPARVGSMVLQLNGAQTYKRTENGPPYALYGDMDGDYAGASLPVGDYTLKATPHSISKGEGQAGTPQTIHFKVIYPAAIAQFTLVNAGTGEDLGVLAEGRVIDLAGLPGARLNIRAGTSPAQTGRVVFALSGALVRTHTENLVPYALFGDDTKGNYYGAALPAGDYTLTATPYSLAVGGGAMGTPMTIHFTVKPAVGPGCTTASFAPVVSYPSTGNYLTDITTGDFNGDGKPDLAVAFDLVQEDVGVLLGKGDGSFAAIVRYASGHSGGGASSVAAADLNGDGKLDLVVGNYTGTVGVLLGRGDGSFAGAVAFPGGGYSPRSVAVSDLNGDGKPDVLVAHFGIGPDYPGSMGVLLGDGNGSLGPVVTFPSGGKGGQAVTAGDLDGDGKPDALVANYHSGTVGWLRGTGDGSFAGAVTFPSGGTGPSSLAISDFNEDGKLDLAVNHTLSDGFGVLLGDGNGSFAPTVTFPGSGSLSASLALGDFNADGHVDVASDNSFFNTLVVLQGNGKGSFAQGTAFPSKINPHAIATADFDQDGKPDLAVAHYSIDAPVGVLLNTCGSASPPVLTKARQKSLRDARAEKTIHLRASPNPFFSQTTIHFSAGETGYTQLGVYNTSGKEVARLYEGQVEAGGTYGVTFESKGLPSGVYILRLATQYAVTPYRVVLVR